MRYQYAGRLRAGDYVYLFISSRYPPLLDRLFASPLPVEVDDEEFFGAFAIDPSRPVADLQSAYGIELRPGEEDLTIAEMMAARLGGQAEYADRIVVGPVELIVRDVDDAGKVETVGVSLEPEAQNPQVPLFLTGREVAQKLRAFIAAQLARRKRQKPEEEAESEPSGVEADAASEGETADADLETADRDKA